MDALLDIANSTVIQFASLLSRTTSCIQSDTQKNLKRSKWDKNRLCWEDSGTTLMSNGSLQGNHWALLAIDVGNKCAYYGNSLQWPVPHNLISELCPYARVQIRNQYS